MEEKIVYEEKKKKAGSHSAGNLKQEEYQKDGIKNLQSNNG